jgi:hypothetical protein
MQIFVNVKLANRDEYFSHFKIERAGENIDWRKIVESVESDLNLFIDRETGFESRNIRVCKTKVCIECGPDDSTIIEVKRGADCHAVYVLNLAVEQARPMLAAYNLEPIVPHPATEPPAEDPRLPDQSDTKPVPANPTVEWLYRTNIRLQGDVTSDRDMDVHYIPKWLLTDIPTEYEDGERLWVAVGVQCLNWARTHNRGRMEQVINRLLQSVQVSVEPEKYEIQPATEQQTHGDDVCGDSITWMANNHKLIHEGVSNVDMDTRIIPTWMEIDMPTDLEHAERLWVQFGLHCLGWALKHNRWRAEQVSERIMRMTNPIRTNPPPVVGKHHA